MFLLYRKDSLGVVRTLVNEGKAPNSIQFIQDNYKDLNDGDFDIYNNVKDLRKAMKTYNIEIDDKTSYSIRNKINGERSKAHKQAQKRHYEKNADVYKERSKVRHARLKTV